MLRLSSTIIILLIIVISFLFTQLILQRLERTLVSYLKNKIYRSTKRYLTFCYNHHEIYDLFLLYKKIKAQSWDHDWAYETSLSGNRVICMRKDTERAHFELALYGKHPELKTWRFCTTVFHTENVLYMRKRYGTGSLWAQTSDVLSIDYRMISGQWVFIRNPDEKLY